MPVIRCFSRFTMIYSTIILIAGLYLAFALLSQVSAEPAIASNEVYRYYKETGHNVSGLFLRFYDAHGGKEMFGFPITEVITDTETGRAVQYFEHARLELHAHLPPESAVVLTNLGTYLTSGREEWVFQRQPRETILPDTLVLPVVGLRYFLETGHSLRGAFGAFWDAHDGRYRFGYPISEPLVEKRGRRTVLVQYFERTRLEYHLGMMVSQTPYSLGCWGANISSGSGCRVTCSRLHQSWSSWRRRRRPTIAKMRPMAATSSSQRNASTDG